MRSVNKKFFVLHLLSATIAGIGWTIVAIAGIVAIWGAVGGSSLGEAMSVTGIYAPKEGVNLGLALVIIWATGVAILGILFVASGQMIRLALAIEEHTRASRESLASGKSAV